MSACFTGCHYKPPCGSQFCRSRPILCELKCNFTVGLLDHLTICCVPRYRPTIYIAKSYGGYGVGPNRSAAFDLPYSPTIRFSRQLPFHTDRPAASHWAFPPNPGVRLGGSWIRRSTFLMPRLGLSSSTSSAMYLATQARSPMLARCSSSTPLRTIFGQRFVDQILREREL